MSAKYIQVASHDVSGCAAWEKMVAGMVAAPEAEQPPHMALIKKFWCGKTSTQNNVSVCHCIEGKENLDKVQELFKPDSEFLKGFTQSPVMKDHTDSMKWNNFEVMVEYPKGESTWSGVEEGDILGVYSHGVPSAAEWAKIFENAVSADEGAMHKNSGIVKSFGGKMFDSEWKAAEGAEAVAVIHVFKSLDDKAKFDKMFDPTGDFFGGMIAAGGAFEPFYSLCNGPIFILDGK